MSRTGLIVQEERMVQASDPSIISYSTSSFLILAYLARDHGAPAVHQQEPSANHDTYPPE